MPNTKKEEPKEEFQCDPVFVLSRSDTNELLGVFSSLEKVHDNFPEISELPMNYRVKEVQIDAFDHNTVRHWCPVKADVVVWKLDDPIIRNLL